MPYNVLRRSVKSGKKTVHRWYYSFIDPDTGIKKQRVIPSCRNQAEAYAFIAQLPDIDTKKILIKDICKEMFIPGSMHLIRLAQHGTHLEPETLRRHRRTTKIIISLFGNIELKDLTVMMVDNFLTNDTKHKGSWKNAFLETLSHIYREAPFYGCNVIKPSFRRFDRNNRKADVLTTEELNLFFNPTFWDNERDYLTLLCMASFGLRIGEVRAIQARQFIFEKNALLVDGLCKQNGTRIDHNKKGSDDNKKWRITFAPYSTVTKIKSYIERNNITGNEYVFQREGGRPVRQEYLDDVFQRQLIKAGIDVGKRKLIPHSFRFTYVTKVRRNADVESIRKMVGHTSVEMTDYYTIATIPETINSLENVVPAVNELFN